jgi:acetate kinase
LPVDINSANRIITVNAGSSSIKLALFEVDDTPKRSFEAVIENIGQPTARFTVKGEAADDVSKPIVAPDHVAAAGTLADWLKQQISGYVITAIGHRIVHGGPKYYEPCVIDDTVMADLGELTLFDPEHLLIELQLIGAFQELYPNVKQVACFDTAFHHELPDVARLLPIPRHYEAKGIRRYGFHGLSYAFVSEEIKRLEGAEAANGRLVLAHLGNGVSLVAVHHGKSIDTTMGLTPASGVPMSTRSGDLDPGLALYLANSEGMDAGHYNDLVNFRSGLLGISETTSDMEELLKHEAEDNRAKEAIDLFCYQVKKSIGGLTAAMGGLDTLVFTGGMGENAPKVRARICEGLEFLGIELEESRNATNANIISADTGRVKVRVIRTDESSTIARDTWQLINKQENGHENKQ